MKAVLGAIAVCGLLLVGHGRAVAQTPSEYATSFGASVACSILDKTLNLPVSLCTIANAEFASGIQKVILSQKSKAYCGSINFSQAKQLFPDSVGDVKKCATVLIASCQLYKVGC